MKMLSRFFCLSLLAMLAIIPSAYAQEILVSPGSGIYLDKSQMNIAVIVPDPNAHIMGVEYRRGDGMPINTWFNSCAKAGRTVEGFPYHACEDQAGALFGLGEFELQITVHLIDGRRLETAAHYTVFGSEKEDISRFVLTASEQPMKTGVVLDPYFDYEIVASGKVSVWPHNPNLPLTADPEGAARPCNYSNCLLPGAPVGALVARLPGEPWVLVGARHVLRGQGALELAVNDHDFGDNIGSFEIEVIRRQH